MASCKDCVHVEVCKDYIKAVLDDFDDSQMCGDDCEFFRDRSRFVELPCKKDDVIFCNNSAGVIIPQKVTGFIIRASGTYVETDMLIHESAIGDFVFLTREEAEQALKECEGK